jgi:hypothetical protein
MSHLSLLNRAFAGSALSIWCVMSASPVAGQNPFKWIVGGDKNVKYEAFKDPDGRFELEKPTKDWKSLPSGGSSLAVFARNDGPTLFVDHVPLTTRLTQGEIEAMPEMEADLVKKQQPKAQAFKSDMLDSRAGRGVLIRYSREGTGPETVVQFSIAVDRDLYRLGASFRKSRYRSTNPSSCT